MPPIKTLVAQQELATLEALATDIHRQFYNAALPFHEDPALDFNSFCHFLLSSFLMTLHKDNGVGSDAEVLECLPPIQGTVFSAANFCIGFFLLKVSACSQVGISGISISPAEPALSAR